MTKEKLTKSINIRLTEAEWKKAKEIEAASPGSLRAYVLSGMENAKEGG